MHPRNASRIDPMDSPADPVAKPPVNWGLGLTRTAIAVVVLGFAFSWFGVYDTSEIPFWLRTAYWVALMAIGFASAAVCTPLVERVLAKAHPAVMIATASAVMSVPITVALIFLNRLRDGEMPPLSLWPTLYLYVIVVSALLTTGQYLVYWQTQKQAPAAPPAQPATPGTATSFLDRLPVRLRTAEIWAVSSEDHYLRVHTSMGEEMILMRLADAVRELAALDGLQTHRSWWVARGGLADAGRVDGRLVLKLKSGTEVPVSRTYLAAVRDKGWV
jgi:uncharacterized membrane protein